MVGDKKKKTPIDYKNLLGKKDFALFTVLRESRNLRAKGLATPSYNICTNEVLSRMATERPTETKQLLEIEGFGEKKVEKYGAEFLKLIIENAQTGSTDKSDS